ncbi:MAG TPA: hypothetical protein DD730_18235 [Desulfosporosinus sp.]|jgi:hypothetical protein|nr:hypothetical protein [Desulfosporosinus sp.]
MNLENVAKIVHELAKSPNSGSMLLSQLKSICEITSSEFNAITKVFSNTELPGNSLAGHMEPAEFWA